MNFSVKTSRCLLGLALMAAPAFAMAEEAASSSASSSSSISSSFTLKLPPLPSSCLSNPGKDKCIPDALKNLERAKSDYVNYVAKKRQIWIEEHASMGRTDEYQILLRAYTTQLKNEGEVFIKQIQEETKKLTANRTNRRGRGGAVPIGSSASSSSVSSAPHTNVDQESLDKCASITDDHKKRLCIRTEANREKLRPKMGKTYR
jgi:hypothetical protein